MRNRKVYQLLLLLDAEEQKGFAEYLRSPLFSSSKTMVRFYDLWRKKMLGEKTKDYSPEEFLKGSKLLPARMDKYCSSLYKKVLDFLALQEYLRSEQAQLEKGAEALERRNAPRREWEIQRERLAKYIDQLAMSTEKSLQQLDFKWKDAEMRTHRRDTPDIWKEDFRDLHLALDGYYHLQKLKLACASVNAHLIYNHQDDPSRDFVQKFRESTDPDSLDALTQVYWHILQLYTDPTVPFQPLFDMLQQESQHFSEAETLEVFGYALNYCMRRGAGGETPYKKFTAALYRELLARGILLVDEQLPAAVMKNMVVVHCVVGELEWVASFLADYGDRLAAGTDPNVLIYNEAILAFFQADYPTAIHKLKQVISQLKNDIFYELDARIYLLEACYEYLPHLRLQEVDEMHRMLDSFRIFIDRNQKISQAHKLNYRNFLAVFRRLLKLMEKQPVPVERLEKFHREIQEQEHLTSKSWFLEKLSPFLKPAS